jgi:hypothetical protein
MTLTLDFMKNIRNKKKRKRRRSKKKLRKKYHLAHLLLKE